ncbi:hypothetical protein [Inediibacterium massiliense]|uniref:hypothetical protein n=1 Tax=Inediibacterium massiliense TaxID=1658111 RepID=UPI0006B4DD6D|nr:hypothetical protein [Inediibacterium massiliense]
MKRMFIASIIAFSITTHCVYAYEAKEPITILTILQYTKDSEQNIENYLSGKLPEWMITPAKHIDVFHEADKIINRSAKFINKKCPNLANNIIEKLDDEQTAYKQQNKDINFTRKNQILSDKVERKLEDIQKETDHLKAYVRFFRGEK